MGRRKMWSVSDLPIGTGTLSLTPGPVGVSEVPERLALGGVRFQTHTKKGASQSLQLHR